ncbi:MAG: hypothetical protein JXA25_20255 [Anaerolineales bacterium]|nr:hypothetical protein [Anaerolineales bacterium]
MNTEKLYMEKVTSFKTGMLFLNLSIFSSALALWRLQRTSPDTLVVIFLLITTMFLFYTLNYRTLLITITNKEVTLQFGLFRWHMPLNTIAYCSRDTFSLWRIGGAGIHFSWFNKRYRAMFNFLEHDRVVLSLKKKKGLVSEVAFTTQNPDKVISLIQAQLHSNS